MCEFHVHPYHANPIIASFFFIINSWKIYPIHETTFGILLYVNRKSRETISEDELTQLFWFDNTTVQDCIKEIVVHSSVRLEFHRIVEPTVRQTNQTVSSSGIFSKNLTSFTNQL